METGLYKSILSLKYLDYNLNYLSADDAAVRCNYFYQSAGILILIYVNSQFLKSRIISLAKRW